MLSLLLAAALGQLEPAAPEGPVVSQPSQMYAAFWSADYAFFEFAPTSGAGMTAACACTTPTGAKGEALTFTRTGAATCSKQGLATTGIDNGDLVVCANNNEPRVEPSGGVLGLRVESAKTNPLLRFIDYANATWADVATPTLTGSQASPWTGTYATSAVQFDDNNAGAFEGRSQTVTVTAAQQYTMCCYVKAGTLAKVRLSLDGTTADHTGLSSSSWSLVSVTDASSSGVAISAQALNGTAAGDTGTVTWGGCGIETGSYCSSMIPTVAAAATRNAELAGFAVSVPTTNGICSAANLQAPSVNAFVAGAGLWAPLPHAGTANANSSAPYVWSYTVGLGTTVAIDGSTSASAPGYNPTLDNVATSMRVKSGHTGSAWAYVLNGAARTSVGSTWNSPTYASVKLFAQTTTESCAIWSRVQVDPNWSRCSP